MTIGNAFFLTFIALSLGFMVGRFFKDNKKSSN